MLYFGSRRMASLYEAMAPSRSPFLRKAIPRLLCAQTYFAWRRMASLYSGIGPVEVALDRQGGAEIVMGPRALGSHGHGGTQPLLVLHCRFRRIQGVHRAQRHQAD